MKKAFAIWCILTTMTSALATGQIWNGVASKDWSTAANRAPAIFPASVSNVIIPGSVACGNWPSFAGHDTINTINMQAGSQLNVNGFTLSLYNLNNYNFFANATLNNSNGATDIIINVNTGSGGYATSFRGNKVNDDIVSNMTGSNQFIEGNATPSNVYNGNASFNINGVMRVYISFTTPSQYNGNFTVSRTVAGSTSLFNAGGTITGNYAFTNNFGGAIGLGNVTKKTSICGTVNITANYTTPDIFEMYRLINNKIVGTITVQNSQGFSLQKDTLNVSLLNITGYKGNEYGRFLNNDITCNISISDDAGYVGCYATYIRNNVIMGNSNYTNNVANNFFDADAAGTGNKYLGSVTSGGNFVCQNKKDASQISICNPIPAPGAMISFHPKDTALYHLKMKQLANGDQSGRWPPKTFYPVDGAILPFKRIVAYYGNFYSAQMGVLGQYPPEQLFAKLRTEIKNWERADPFTPVMPAIHYIAVTAQKSPGMGGKYRLRMPRQQIKKAIELAAKVNGIVFLDIQLGLSTLEEEIPLLKEYLQLPQVHLGIDPEFSMKNGRRPGTTIGTLDAADINYAAEYLSTLVKEFGLPPKILVVHRFTGNMLTNYRKIKIRREIQLVINMDGFGIPAKKKDTYYHCIYKEPVQFAGFKLFYKNDTKQGKQLMAPAEILRLKPQPIYIQYQ